LLELGVCEIERFKAQQLRSSLSPKTINNQMSVLRKSVVTARKWRIINYVPEFDG
jgi:hypothetical protein